jgi:hypothetical protein
VRSALPFVAGVECVHLDLQAGTVDVVCTTACDRSTLLAALRRRGLDGEFLDGGSPAAER